MALWWWNSVALWERTVSLLDFRWQRSDETERQGLARVLIVALERRRGIPMLRIADFLKITEIERPRVAH
jgi:hypothetical protein